MELGEKLAQAVTEITLLHHTLRGLTNELHAALDEQVTSGNKKTQKHTTWNRTTDTFHLCLTLTSPSDLKKKKHFALKQTEIQFSLFSS